MHRNMVQIQMFSLSLLLLLLSLTGSSGQKCGSSLDCESPYAPNCSRWGWCQWTHQFGVQGPDDQNLNKQHKNIKVTEVSKSTIDPRSRARSNKGEIGGGRIRISSRELSDNIVPANTILLQRSVELTADRKEPQGLFGVLTTVTQKQNTKPTIEQSHRRRKSSQTKGRAQSKKGDAKDFYRRRRKSKPVQQLNTKERGELPSFKDVSTIRNTPSSITTKTAPTPARIERQSSDYDDYDDYYNSDNYDYYTEFEVLKMEPETNIENNSNQNQINKSTKSSTIRSTESSCSLCTNGGINNSETRGSNQNSATESTRNNRAEPIKENPSHGESQGCLYDCVYDCVSIIKLTAYRDCVNFCGRTCKDK